MKILYAVQATGNGHIARAIELLPFLEKYGTVDVFLSGNNSHLHPELPIKYRSKGLSLFYGNRGSLDYSKIWQELHFRALWKEARQLPVEQYDLVINDFESITALACRLKGKSSIGFGHQASFMSELTPRPEKKDGLGEWVLHHYAAASNYVGVHFDNYDSFIFSPILKKEILQANPVDKGHVTVYLSHYSDAVVTNALLQCPDIQFHLFSKQVTAVSTNQNITILPINNTRFNESMMSAKGVITGAGFETPAEALYLGKKLMCLPIIGQYEQLCNAAALEKFRVPIIHKLDEQDFRFTIYKWLSGLSPKPLKLTNSTVEIVATVIEKGTAKNHSVEKNNALHLHPSQLSMA